MISKNKILVCFLATIIITSAISLRPLTTNAYTSYRLLNVTAQEQDTDSWCWAACTQMVCNYFGEYPSQGDIVTFIYDWPDPDEGGNVYEMSSALGHWGIHSTTTLSSLSFSTIVSQIENGEPMIASRSNHAEVIRGYYQNTEIGLYDVYYIDPWDASYNIFTYETYSSYWNGGSVYYIYV
ncbi:MAG: C39 family peptidase [Syntrophomonas sp.]|nr:papain-like cysteine protease family protein [Fermentimonas sp.]MDD3890479.1 papain-like cysteine protease family protein [Syntrophomonadaceae bacterium]